MTDALKDILNENNYLEAEFVVPEQASPLPGTWRSIIAAQTVAEKRAILKEMWQPFAEKLRLTVALIDDLEDAIVIKENDEYKLVYIFKVLDAYTAYTGRLPIQEGPFLNQLPADVGDFYRSVHNGWFENISGGLGFLSLQDIELLDAYEWGILEAIPPTGLDLSKLFHVFHNAGGGYLCFNIADPKAPECLIFWSNKEPKRNVSFWTVIDSWIEIGLTY